RDHENNKQPNRIELMTIYREETDFEELTGDPDDKINFSADTLMYISSYLVNENSYLSKGEVWINWFSKYEKFGELEHLYFMTPTFFENEKLPVTISGNEIELLLCVPISQEELEYFENNGASALEELLYEKNIDVSNLFRKSVI
ncbi:suppressor of fused domain protein, partial [Paenibacillus plantiphilus]